jgi:hypothetical protein
MRLAIVLAIGIALAACEPPPAACVALAAS